MKRAKIVALVVLVSSVAWAIGNFYYVTNIPKCRDPRAVDSKHRLTNKRIQGPPVPIKGVPAADCMEREWWETCSLCFSSFITMIERVGPRCPKDPPPRCATP